MNLQTKKCMHRYILRNINDDPPAPNRPPDPTAPRRPTAFRRPTPRRPLAPRRPLSKGEKQYFD
jgi:hypothetical protein